MTKAFAGTSPLFIRFVLSRFRIIRSARDNLSDLVSDHRKAARDLRAEEMRALSDQEQQRYDKREDVMLLTQHWSVPIPADNDRIHITVVDAISKAIRA